MRVLKTSTVLLFALLASGALLAQGTDEASAMLEAAIQKQVISGDLGAAAAQYETILARFAENRRVASQALWRLAQCHEQLGHLDKARQSYERLIREHADQASLVKAAQARLASLLDVEDLSDPDLSRQIVVDMMMQPQTRQDESAGFGCCRPVVFSDLAVFDPRTRMTRRLTEGARSMAYPVLSPNSQRVAYLSWNGDLKEKPDASEGDFALAARAGSELRVVGLNGSDDRSIFRDPNIRSLRPIQWSPDGGSIVTLFERTNGRREIAIVSVEGGSVRVLKSLPWLSVQDVGFSEDGQFLAYQVTAPRDSEQMDLFILPLAANTGPSVDRRFSLSLVGQRGAKVTEDDLVIHVLNRLGYGPRLGDIERVKSMGVDAYIEQQLHPERMADPVVDAKIADFTSLKMELPDVLAKAGPLVDIANRRRATIFELSDMQARDENEKKKDPNRDVTRTSADPLLMYPDDRPYDAEINAARMIRAVHSMRQLQEVMVDFWMNHFNVNFNRGADQLTVDFEERVRRNAFGRFEDLLSGVAHNPNMLFYLDNWRSSAPTDVIEQRFAEIRKTGDVDAQVSILERLSFLKGSKGLNENFARELLELHTVGVDGGYTQQDVIGVAKILTGWTIRSRGLVNGHEDDGVFMFDPIMHITGDKVVMGHTFKSGGVEEGEELLTMLAHHPSTARHIATKLARRLIADDPPAAVIESASRTFLRTGGDVREVVKAIITSPEFRSPEAIRAKIKKPFELVVSALRAVDATIDDRDNYAAFLNAGGTNNWVSRMGEKVYNHEAPDGNPDVGSAWMNSNALLLRLDFANRLATDKLRGIQSNLSSAARLLAQLNIPKPTTLQMEQTRAMLQSANAAAAPSMGGQQMMMGGGQASAAATAPINPLAIEVAAMLGSPQFQKR